MRAGFFLVALAIALALPGIAAAQTCKRDGGAVTCDDGRKGIFAGDAIIWPDGTRSSAASNHPGVVIGHRDSVRVGPGVFVGRGGGAVPLEDPSAPHKRQCAILDGVSYCH